MKFSQFIDVFVAALYNETGITGRTAFPIKDIVRKYGLSLNPNWRESLFTDHAFSSRVQARRHLGPIEDQQITLSPDGFRWVEDELGENVAEFLERNGATYEYGSEEKKGFFDPAIFDPAFFDTGEAVEGTTLPSVPSFASANWTGIDEKLGPLERAQISDLSASLVAAINQAELDDRTKKSAVKHVEAVQKLLEAPDPPWKAIVELLNHPAITAFLIAVQILQLIWGAAN